LENEQQEEKMVGMLRPIHFISCYRWVGKVVLFFFCGSLMAYESKILSQDGIDAAIEMGLEFDKMETSSSQEALVLATEFFDHFISEINSTYGMQLTVEEAFQLVKENIHVLPLSLEERQMILNSIDLLQSSNRVTAGGIYWPWEWSWFGLNDPRKEGSSFLFPDESLSLNQAFGQSPSNHPSNHSDGIPGSCILGGCEMLAGAILCLIQVPGLPWLGGVIIVDGVRRMGDGLVQMDNMRRNDPYYVEPQSPF
jgi:hypothetical protein